MIYIGLALLVLILEYFYRNVPERQKKAVWFLACFIVWFFMAFRDYNIGADTPVYIQHFKTVQRLSWDKIPHHYDKDTGFYFLLKALSIIWSNNTWFLAATAFLALIGVFSFIRRNTARPVLALFFFITLGNFHFILTGMRQAIAMSLCLLALPFAEQKKPLRFAALVILGAMCHKSAYIFLLAYFIVRRQISPLNMLINAAAIAVAFFSYETLLAYANEILEYDYGVEELSNGYLFFAIVLAVMILAWLYHKAWIKENRNTVAMNMGVVALGMWTIRLFSRTIERPAIYWLNSLPVILANVLDNQANRKLYSYFYYGAILVALVLFARRSIGLPYAFIF